VLLDEHSLNFLEDLTLVQGNRLPEQIGGLIQLTRWREHIIYDVPLTLLGALLAVQASGGSLDWRLIMVILANIFAVAYAFMINDIEDAPDDARDPARAAKNPISSGRIHARIGYAVCRMVAVIALALYAFGGLEVLLIGMATLLLSHLYSWRAVRLKAYPVTDIVSHSLMLSGLLMLAGYYLYHNQPGIVWLVAAGVTLISVYGQLYNQLRDYDMDKAAGLHNTAIILGERNTRLALYLTIASAGLCLLAAIVQGVFPLWLAVALGASIVASILFAGGSHLDARGTEVVDVSGRYQMQALIVINLTIIIWLAASLLIQFQIL
jgi:4-hydroxybenzoate polyprenyltransferase